MERGKTDLRLGRGASAPVVDACCTVRSIVEHVSRPTMVKVV
jgi:hypothetical protein